MLEVFRHINDYDAITFVPNLDGEEGTVKVDVSQYRDKGESLDSSSMGDMFDIIIFRMTDEYDMTDLERFQGILVDARVYVSRMIKENWFGMVSRKTTTSGKMADEVFASWKEMDYNK